jgi:hypothetical protein
MLDLSKPVQTRDGRAARIICTDKKNLVYPIVALITTSAEIETLKTYTPAGQLFAISTGKGLSRHDLINVPVVKTGWLNMYPRKHTSPTLWRTKELADEAACTNRIACIKVEYTEGEGLTDGDE